MPLIDTIETHFTGPRSDLRSMGIFTVAKILVQVCSILRYIVFYTIWSGVVFVLDRLVNGQPCKWIIKTKISIINRIPIIGKPIARKLDGCVMFFSDTVLAKLESIKMFIETLFQLSIIDMTLKNKNVKLVITGEKLDFTDAQNRQSTSLLVSNHRSIMDYVLINYLVQVGSCKELSSRKYLWSKIIPGSKPISTFPKVNFITWSKITNFPKLSLLFNILSKDENCSVTPSKIKKHLEAHGNSVLAIFPEVNIITPELSIVQRKLTEEYDLPRLKNLLYPRFKNFISTIKCFARIKHVKRRDHKFKKVVDKVDKLVNKVKDGNQVNDKEVAQLNMFLCNEAENATVGAKGTEQQKFININDSIFDLTIVYYQPILTDDTHTHDHTGQQGDDCHYQLEQITPSLFQFLGIRNSDSPPIVIRVDVKKHELSQIIQEKERKLEKWLETNWCIKDKTVDSMESNVKIS